MLHGILPVVNLGHLAEVPAGSLATAIGPSIGFDLSTIIVMMDGKKIQLLIQSVQLLDGDLSGQGLKVNKHKPC